MIKRKEDLLNTYIENDKGELRDLYFNACVKFKLHDKYKYNTMEYQDKFIASFDGYTVLQNQSFGSGCVSSNTKLTISDFKEVSIKKTKVEYVKCDYTYAWEAMKAFECGDVFYTATIGHEYIKRETAMEIVADYNCDSIYRKVETEITWRDEAAKAFPCANFGEVGFGLQINMGFWTEDGLIKLSHIIAGMTDKPV